MVKKQRNFLWLRHAKAHDDGSLKNPLFQKPKRKRWVLILIATVCLALTLGAVIGMTYLPFLNVASIEVTGTTTLNHDDISQKTWDVLQSNSLPLISNNCFLGRSRERIAKALYDTFALNNIIITRQGTKITISVEEKVTTITLRTKEKTVFLDLSGNYVRDATKEESRAIDVMIGSTESQDGEELFPIQKEMPIILDTQNDAETILSSTTTQIILELEQSLIAMGIHPKTYTIDGLNAPWTTVSTDKTYVIYFDLTRSAKDQIQTLTAILNQNTVTPEHYIDVRFGAYVYIK